MPIDASGPPDLQCTLMPPDAPIVFVFGVFASGYGFDLCCVCKLFPIRQQVNKVCITRPRAGAAPTSVETSVLTAKTIARMLLCIQDARTCMPAHPSIVRRTS